MSCSRVSFQKQSRVVIAVDHQAKIGRLRARQLRIGSPVGECVVFEHDEARKVDRIKIAERKERVRRVGGAWNAGQRHRRQERAQRRDAVVRNHGGDDEIVLGDHGEAP